MLKELGIEPPQPAESDGSAYLQRYAITSTGEPIGICEYGSDIASTGESAYVVSLIDFQADLITALGSHHIKKNEPFHELVLPNRRGRSRHIAIERTDIMKVFEYFRVGREEDNRHVF